MNYVNFSKQPLSIPNTYSTLTVPTATLTSPKLSASGVLAPQSSGGSAGLAEVCYHLSRATGSIVSASADARPLYILKSYNPILNDIRTLVPEAVEGYSSLTTNWRPNSLGHSSISYALTSNTVTDWSGTPVGYAVGLHNLSNLKTYILDLNTVQRAGPFNTSATPSNFDIYTNIYGTLRQCSSTQLPSSTNDFIPLRGLKSPDILCGRYSLELQTPKDVLVEL